MSDNWNEKLFEASRDGDLSRLEASLRNGADVNAQGIVGDTALYWSAYYDRVDCVQALIEAGAELDIQHKNGNTALVRAAEFGYTECVRQLVGAGADISLLGEPERERYASIIGVELKKHRESQQMEQQQKLQSFRGFVKSRGL